MVFKPGTSGNLNGRPKGAKNKTTLDKEQRRALFEELVSEKWEEIIKKLPPTYVADQFIGKAKDTVEHKVTFLFDEDAED